VDARHERMGGIDGALDVSKMKEMFDTKVFGLVDLTNRIVPAMKERGEGDIVNLASTSGMKGAATATSYAASKWALRGISQCWQAELRPHGLRVICICPSEVQTNFDGKSGRNNPNKLYAADIADTIMAALNIRVERCGRSSPCSPTTLGRNSAPSLEVDERSFHIRTRTSQRAATFAVRQPGWCRARR
jgi:NAD(P)-dependent dehydrogenase (short-subunit alcohol dehydrogenase family)